MTEYKDMDETDKRLEVDIKYNQDLQSQLTKSNNKIEKIKEYIDNNYWCWENGSGKPADILSIIDGSDE